MHFFNKTERKLTRKVRTLLVFRKLYFHNMKFGLLFIILLPIIGFAQVDFRWVDSLDGDFSFTENWDYPEGVYVNQWGQLSCDGFCPMEIDKMKDDQGRLFDDSLSAFYSIVDTTHRYFTHEGIVRTYEYGECNHAFAKVLNGKMHVQTEVNVSTHTSLHIVFDAEVKLETEFKIYLIYNSIRNTKPIVYLARSGDLEISKKMFKEGIVKMSFDLKFEDISNNPKFEQTWNGKILVGLTSKQKFYTKSGD